MRKIPARYATTKMERHVRRWLNDYGRDSPRGAADAFRDLMIGGCGAGTVSHLIYNKDTDRFFAAHADDISDVVRDLEDSCGQPISRVLVNWDADDPLARRSHNRFLLAHLGFEQAARSVGARAGL